MPLFYPGSAIKATLACVEIGFHLAGRRAGILSIKNLKKDVFALRLVHILTEPLMFYVMEKEHIIYI